MSEDVFHLVVAIGVALACLTFIIQAGILIALYSAVRKFQERVSPLIEKGEAVVTKAAPVVEKLGPVIDHAKPAMERAAAVLATTQEILDDTRPRISEIVNETAAITKSGRVQAERLGQLLEDASTRARDRLEQIDRTVDNTVEQVEHAGESVKRAVLRPVREINGIAAGISAAVSTLVRGPRRSPVDHATQDEEMFI